MSRLERPWTIAGLALAVLLPTASALAQASFDFREDLSGWSQVLGTRWSELDAGFSSASGSLALSANGRSFVCVPYTQGSGPWSVKMKILGAEVAAPDDFVVATVSFFDQPACGGAAITSGFAQHRLGDLTPEWTPLEFVAQPEFLAAGSFDPGDDVQSAQVQVGVGGAVVYVDDVVLVAVAPGAPLCQRDVNRHCLLGGRYEVMAQTFGPAGGTFAMTLPQSDDTGLFWFFDKSNVELMVKVLDGCGINGHVWVFAGGLTDYGVILTVRDTVDGSTWERVNELGTPFEPILDTEAFASCP